MINFVQDLTQTQIEKSRCQKKKFGLQYLVSKKVGHLNHMFSTIMTSTPFLFLKQLTSKVSFA